MNAEQKEIYYITGESRNGILQNPNLEYFKEKGIEVIYLYDPVDVFTFPYITDYDGKQLKSIDKADIEFKKDEFDKHDKLNKEKSKSLFEYFKQILGDKIEDVVESVRLVDSPVTLVVGKQGFDPQMEKMMQIIDKEFTASKRILEVNIKHPIIKNISELIDENPENPLLKDSISLLYESALLLDGYLKAPQDFVKRVNLLLEIATNNIEKNNLPE
jgi:molecular chaperone HtpG